MTYAEARAYIASLEKRGWRLGLDRMQEFLRRIGNPHEGQKFFHVAGTNGKGSVTAMIASVLKAAGYRTGAFYSPYVYDFRERIQINGEMIPEEDVSRLTEYLMPFSEELAKTDFGGPTEFEFKTAMGFLYWKEQKCDYVALEVGLGGRLDATNVVMPLVSVITEIGLDHQQYLGNTIEEIAREKAGIIKPGVPVVTGATNDSAIFAIRQVAERECSEVWQLGIELQLINMPRMFGFDVVEATITTPVAEHLKLKCNLIGEYQVRNTAVAVGALDAAGLHLRDPILEEGLALAHLPGRLERMKSDSFIYLDGAHNAQAIRATLRALYRELDDSFVCVVYSAATGHDLSESFEALKELVAEEGIYAAPMAHPRSVSIEELQRLTSNVYPSVREAIEAAWKEWKGNAFIATGSFYLLGEAKEAFLQVIA